MPPMIQRSGSTQRIRQETVIGTDKSNDGHGLVVYDLSGRELFYYPDGRMNNVDVRYNFPLGDTQVALVGVTNRVRSLDFYRVNVADRSLTKVGSLPVPTSPRPVGSLCITRLLPTSTRPTSPTAARSISRS